MSIDERTEQARQEGQKIINEQERNSRTMTHDTIDNLKWANCKIGQHFFDRATLRFFRSRVGMTLHSGPGGEFFVTSEQFDDGRGYRAPRLYTVRQAMPDGRVRTVGEFQQYASNSGATAAAKRYAQKGTGEQDY